ncbi:hypothetical protein D3C75_1250920 [compost metagenome]
MQLSFVPASATPSQISKATLLLAPKLSLVAVEQVPAPGVAVIRAESTPEQSLKSTLNASVRLLLVRSDLKTSPN